MSDGCGEHALLTIFSLSLSLFLAPFKTVFAGKEAQDVNLGVAGDVDCSNRAEFWRIWVDAPQMHIMSDAPHTHQDQDQLGQRIGG